MIEYELHAFIDGELAGEEQGFVLDAVNTSYAAREQLEKLQRLKALIRTAYQTDGCCTSARFKHQHKCQSKGR